MRRRSLVAGILVLVAVLLALSWFGWSREGLTPVAPASPGAEAIDELYLFIAFFAIAIFLAVMVPLALILGRYRARGLPRGAEGPQVRGNLSLELAWTVVPLGIVAVIVAVTLYQAGTIADPEPAAGAPDELTVRVEGRQFYWRYVYPNGAIAIDRLRLPVDREAHLIVTAPDHDVVHSYWVPALGGKVDAIPGQTNDLRYLPTRTGVFEGKCAELCGIQHAAMLFDVEVMPAGDFDRWLEQTGREQAEAGVPLGEALFVGVCTKCHFAAPEYAPSIAGNPLLADDESMREIVRNGRGRMPAVGKGWTEREMNALLAYLYTLAPQEQADGG